MPRCVIEATFPSPLDPPNTGNTDADDAILKLRTFPKDAWSPRRRPSGKEYEALVARAEAVGPEKLVQLLDDAMVQTGRAVWDDEQVDALPAKARRKFKKDYEKALSEVEIRLAYLHWLAGAVCNTEAGFERVLEALKAGTEGAQNTMTDALVTHLQDGLRRLRVAEALDLREWDGESGRDDMGRTKVQTHAHAVALLCEQVSPAEVYQRYAEILDDETKERRDALLRGLMRADSLDPRWAPGVLTCLSDRWLRFEAVRVLERLEPDESWVEPLLAVLPDPAKPGGYWDENIMRQLARVADRRALPYFIAALERNGALWKPCFEGLRKIGDPAGAHVVRDFIAARTAPEQIESGKALIAELEKDGVAPRPLVTMPESKPARERPVLTYEKGPKPRHPTVEPLEELERVYRKEFTNAGLEGVYEKLAQRAVLMFPTRVKEAEVALGGTKLGGHPDLPARAKWPRVRKEPLTFLAQIDLADVAPLLPEGALPEAGLLSFFMGNDFEGPAGYCEKAKVIFTEPRTELVRREVPEDFYDVIFQAARVDLVATVTLPSPSNKHVGKVLRGKKRDAYEEVYEACDAEDPVVPQLLGYRRQSYDAQEPGTSELLLQLPGDDQTQMQFGDADVLGIYIARKKLEARDFSRVRPRLGEG